jgi:hypothetical protein
LALLAGLNPEAHLKKCITENPGRSLARGSRLGFFFAHFAHLQKRGKYTKMLSYVSTTY